MMKAMPRRSTPPPALPSSTTAAPMKSPSMKSNEWGFELLSFTIVVVKTVKAARDKPACGRPWVLICLSRDVI
jgi:hypothetical protein